MSRFLICSFALVLLYPAGIDMYLVGLPRIAADLNASEAQLHIAFSVYLAGMAAAMLVSLLLIMFVAPGRPVAAHEEIHHHA